ncbi:hypothetical protein CDV36_014364 [Fusarium kuroshium]|uniref:Myb-like DNA-binding protein myb-1 n=2 Tax=Fusarium solani species complex TaxID=232080 RepID=A0A3M2RI18_9HYPO|nr:hypothetical protein CDV36_014364 [Fusarium kuroshium]RSL70160.1 hypothetical protein CEP51_012240 [Fusarium floridanum]
MGRQRWSSNEDNTLKKLVQAWDPPDWNRIAQKIGPMTARQCRERYKNFLDPNLNKKEITQEEGATIDRLVEEMGKNWADVARRLGGRRTGNAVKNWWHNKQNRLKKLASRQHLVTDYEGSYNHDSFGLSTTTQCLLLPWTQPPPTLPLDHRHPVHPIEARLSLSCYSKPAESDAGSPYTMSPARHPLVLYEFAELPPLHLPKVPAMVDLQPPGQFPSMSSPVFPAYRDQVESQPHRPSLSLQGQLPTAPDMSPQQQQQHQTHDERDSPMKLSSILS